MAKARSPQYPVIGLKEAIDKARAVYGKDYQTPTQREVIASHMGYNSLNGKSLGVLSAIGKYGLLEGRGTEYRVSDLAVRIIAHSPGDPERAAAIREAAEKPDLFIELDKRFPEGKASDQAIRSYLLIQKFIPAAADAAIRAYRETKQLVEQESAGYDPGDVQPPREQPPMPPQQQQRRDPAKAFEGAFASPSAEATFRIAFAPDQGIELSGWVTSPERADELIGTIQALKTLLRPAAKPAVATDEQQHRTMGEGVPFMITLQQKAELRERGYTDEQIHEMKPEDAHSVLG